MADSAVHGIELPYIFNQKENTMVAGEIDTATAAKIQEAWINFAKSGDPTVDGVIWKPYNTDTRDTMVIKTDQWKCVSDPSKTPRELLEKAFGDEPYHVW